MTAKEWEKKTRQACKDLGVYKKSFESVISTLGIIMEKRDAALESYNGVPIVEHTNSHGETNLAKNPALMLWMDCDKLALTYWKELGLTPASYKKMTGGKTAETKESALVDALKALETG